MIKPIKKLTLIKNENAQTMVEFAIVFPVLLVIIYGLIEFGRMVFIYAAVTGAAREGARYGAAAGDFNDKYYMDCSGILNAVQRGAILTTINNVSVWYDRGPNTIVVSATCPPIDSYGIDKIKKGDRIVVRVSVHYSPIIAVLNLSGFDIQAENARTILFNVEVDGAALPTNKNIFASALPNPDNRSNNLVSLFINSSSHANPQDSTITKERHYRWEESLLPDFPSYSLLPKKLSFPIFYPCLVN